MASRFKTAAPPHRAFIKKASGNDADLYRAPSLKLRSLQVINPLLPIDIFAHFEQDELHQGVHNRPPGDRFRGIQRVIRDKTFLVYLHGVFSLSLRFVALFKTRRTLRTTVTVIVHPGLLPMPSCCQVLFLKFPPHRWGFRCLRCCFFYDSWRFSHEPRSPPWRSEQRRQRRPRMSISATRQRMGFG